MGDPKATATPAALDAVTISRIFADHQPGNSCVENRTYSDSGRIA